MHTKAPQSGTKPPIFLYWKTPPPNATVHGTRCSIKQTTTLFHRERKQSKQFSSASRYLPLAPSTSPVRLHPSSTAPKQKLHIFRRKLLHRDLIVIDRAIDHVGFLFLQHDHPALDRVLDAQTRDHARAFLSDPMAAISGLPFGGGIPPSGVWSHVSLRLPELKKI